MREHLAFAVIAEMRQDHHRAAEHQDCHASYRVNASYGMRNMVVTTRYIIHRRGTTLFRQHIEIQAYNNLWPLWVGIATEDQAKRVIERYLLNEEEFRSDYGIRSMSKSERFYNNTWHVNPMPGAPRTGPVMHGWCSNWQGPSGPYPPGWA